jgi:deoxyadenosine/deoxycytidine kinase
MASLVFLEGSIGAGKSTVLFELEKKGYTVVQEPVAIWAEHLRRVYHDEHWSKAMHVLALTTHVETILQALRMAKDGQRTVVVERSFDSVDVFVQADANMAANDSYNTIHEMYRELLAKELQNFNVKTIYMRTDPSQCLSRISTRARPGEDGITEDYLATLHNVHEAKFSNCDVCVDANNSLDSVVDSIVLCIS